MRRATDTLVVFFLITTTLAVPLAPAFAQSAGPAATAGVDAVSSAPVAASPSSGSESAPGDGSTASTPAAESTPSQGSDTNPQPSVPASTDPTAVTTPVSTDAPSATGDAAAQPDKTSSVGQITKNSAARAALSTLSADAQTSQTGPNLGPSVYSSFDQDLVKIDKNTGALDTTYPIMIPPGRSNLQPDMDLVYSSQDSRRGNIFGQGWSTSIPSIERVNSNGVDNLYNANVPGRFTSTLDGELATTTTDSAYIARTDNGAFNKYNFSNNQWVMTDKNGTRYTFGSTGESRQSDPNNADDVYKWMLKEVDDTNGNNITYSYFTDSGQIYPSTVVYTGSVSTSGIFEVDFIRIASTDNAASFATGFAVRSNYRIGEIDVQVSGSWVRKYILNYGAGDNGDTSLLTSISRSGRDSLGVVVSLPPSTFSYQTHTAGWTSSPAWNPPSPFVANLGSDNGMRVADVNGDNLPDIISGSAAYLNNGNGWTSSSTWISPAPFSASGQDTGVRVVDVNGDNLPDIISGSAAYINNGSGWTASSLWISPASFASNGVGTGAIIADVNGDGLPDIISGSAAYINNGNGWTSNPAWGPPVPFAADGGVDNGARVADVNGDGLPDILSGYTDASGAAQYAAYINNGNGWTSDPTWYPPAPFMTNGGWDSGMRIADVNGDGLPDIIAGYSDVSGNPRYAAYTNNGHGWTSDPAWIPPAIFDTDGGYDAGMRVADLNGDGLPDIISGSTDFQGSPQFGAWMNNNKNRSDLLTGIGYPQGGTSVIEYQSAVQSAGSSGNGANQAPYPIYVVSKITTNDGAGNQSLVAYRYSGGLYYYGGPYDRQFAGFGTVTETDAAGNVTKTYFHTGRGSDSARGEYQDNFWKIGKPYRIENFDGAGNLYKKTINKWDSFGLGGNATFVMLDQTVSSEYDGGTTHKDVAETHIYDDATGNEIQKIQWGQVTGSDDGSFADTGSDKYTTNDSYAADTTGVGVIGKVSDVVTSDQNGTRVKETRYLYDNLPLGSAGAGNVSEQDNWISASVFASVKNTYNSYGLVTATADPLGNETSYIYDAFNLYAVSVTNALNQSAKYQYDYASGKATETIDPNGSTFQTTYDGLGRTLQELQPSSDSSSSLALKTAYTYSDSANAISVAEQDYLNGTTTVSTYRYYDGLNRLVQTRRSASDAGVYKVSDRAYNNMNLLRNESLPYFGSDFAKTSPTSTAALFTNYTYDPLGRVLTAANAVGTITDTFAPWETTVTDARGNPKDELSDAYGNLSEVDEHNGANTYVTAYSYDGLGDLLHITDANGNVRNFTYDGLGRRQAAEDLHLPGTGAFGVWNYTYDAAGNATSRTDPKNQTVTYAYDALNRELTESVAGSSGPAVTYTYDTCANGVGRMCSATSADATVADIYDSVGNVSTETKTIDGTGYSTAYTYDRQGNKLTITNPDSSVVSYVYNGAGLLASVQEQEPGAAGPGDVVSSFEYSPMDQVTRQVDANGATTENVYDPARLYRLNNKITTAGDPAGTQNISNSKATGLAAVADASSSAPVQNGSTVPSLVKTASLGANVSLPNTAASLAAPAAGIAAATTVTQTYTGTVATYTVPADVVKLSITAYGAQGGNFGSFAGGQGGEAYGTLSVTPGQTLYIFVGGQNGRGGGGGPFNAGYCGVSGGGMTWLSTRSSFDSSALVVAGGGGGAGCSPFGGFIGGAGGGFAGNAGTGSSGGGGGTQTVGGLGGTAGSFSSASGSFGQGGQGGFTLTANVAYGGGGGGGGGYYGGGGGGASPYGGADGYGGGGGSSFISGSLTDSGSITGANSGNGSLVIVEQSAPPPIRSSLNQYYLGSTTPISDGSLTSSSAQTAGSFVTNPTVIKTFTGAVTSYTVPSGVTQLSITANGAEGGGPGGGLGGKVTGVLAVTPGTTYYINVGGQSGYNGGNLGGPAWEGGRSGARNAGGMGGGMTWISANSVFTTSTVLLVAGGGGGVGGQVVGSGTGAAGAGGSGGGGGGGTGSVSYCFVHLCAGGGGGGGQTDGGSAGTPAGPQAYLGTVGFLGQGGFGGYANYLGGAGGGGGGGYYGGGGGAGNGYSSGGFSGGGGGGGSSYMSSFLTDAANLPGVNTGDGSVTIIPITPLAALNQFYTDWITPIVKGDSTDQGSVMFGATLNSNATSSLQLQVEVEPGGSAFTNIPNVASSAFVPTGTAVTVTFTGQTGSYHWQARIMDAGNNASSWQMFSSSVAATDFVLAPPPPVKRTFVTKQFTGGVASYTVPAGVSKLTVTVYGAQGNGRGDYWAYDGGLGGMAAGTFPVRTGMTYYYNIGSQGGYGGGGSGCYVGGGMTWFSGSSSFDPSVLAAAAGGGGAALIGLAGTYGGYGGGTTGGQGGASRSGWPGAGGGTQSGGGNPGSSTNFSGTLGSRGGFGTGGNGYLYAGACGGGGGAGYYGGGGGSMAYNVEANGGGGGSSYVSNLLNNTSTAAGVNSGDGHLSIIEEYSPITPLTSMNQYDADGIAPLAAGDSTGQGAVVFGAILNSNATSSLQLQVEVEPFGTAFTNVPNIASSVFVAPGAAATSTFTGPPGNYHWQARAHDASGISSFWQTFSPNVVSNDFALSTTSLKTYTGAVGSFTVPPHVKKITVTAYGAQGGSSYGSGGQGGSSTGSLPVTPGTTYYYGIGGQAGSGQGNGGGQVSGAGGGGMTWFSTQYPFDTSHVLVVGGGGGGAGGVDFPTTGFGGKPGGVGGYNGGGAGGDATFSAAGTGGGGGGWWGGRTGGGGGFNQWQANNGGTGGGITGGSGVGFGGGGAGGTQTSGYSQGIGQSGSTSFALSQDSGGGGSGYISPLLTQVSGQNGVNSGNGSLLIAEEFDAAPSISLPPPGSDALDAEMPLSEGSTTNQGGVMFGAVLNSYASSKLQLQVEVEPLGTAFTNVPNVTSSALVASGNTATTIFTGPNGSYHWQGRAIDAQNNTSAWQIFGPITTLTDFTIAAPHIVFTLPANGATTPNFPNWQLSADAVSPTDTYQLQVTWSATGSAVQVSTSTATGADLIAGVSVPKTPFSGDTTLNGTPVAITANAALIDGTGTIIATSTVSFTEGTAPLSLGCGSGKLQCLSYKYDNNGNITSIVDDAPTDAGKTVDYAYDPLNRLISASSSNAVNGDDYRQTFSYDPVGNILTGSAGTYAYNAGAASGNANPDAVSSITSGASSTVFFYDPDGNLASDSSGLAYTWDYNNRLASASSSSATSTYGYDFTGERIKTTNATSTVYDPEVTYSTDGTTPTKHIFAVGALVETIVGTSASSTAYTVFTDHLGGSSMILDSSGAVSELMDYFPYGSPRLDEKSGSYNEKRKYIGQVNDASSNLDYFNARYYSGDRGQFISEDPVFQALGSPKFNQLVSGNLSTILADPQVLNAYSYASDNPITKEDPSGLLTATQSQTAQQIVNLLQRTINLLQQEIHSSSGGGGSSGPSGNAPSVPKPSQPSINFNSGGGNFQSTPPIGVILGGGGGGGNNNIPSFGFFGTMVKSLDPTFKVCRGGDCSANEFLNGAGVTQSADGTLSGVSVRVGANGESGEELLRSLPTRFQGEGGLSTVEEIQAAGGELVKQGADEMHYLINGLTPDKLVELFQDISL